MLPTDTVITVPNQPTQGCELPARQYASAAQCELYSPRAKRSYIPYYVKNRVRMMDDEKKSHSEIINKIQELYNIKLAESQIEYIVSNEKSRSIKDITPKCLEYLEEHKAYVKDGCIFVDDGIPLKHRLSTGLTKQTEVNGCLFVTKYLVATIMGVDVVDDIIIGHKDRDYRNTNYENLEIVKRGQGTSAIYHRLSMKDTDTLAQIYAENKGDTIKVWIDAFEKHGISVSANTIYMMGTGTWKTNVTSKYYDKENIAEWRRDTKYLSYLDLTPEKDNGVYHEQQAESAYEQLAIPEPKETKEEKKTTKPVVIAAPMQLTQDDIRYNELNKLNITKKKKLSYADKKFIIQYTANRKLHSMSMFDVQKELKESGFDYQIGLIKSALNDLMRGGK